MVKIIYIYVNIRIYKKYGYFLYGFKIVKKIKAKENKTHNLKPILMHLCNLPKDNRIKKCEIVQIEKQIGIISLKLIYDYTIYNTKIYIYIIINAKCNIINKNACVD